MTSHLVARNSSQPFGTAARTTRRTSRTRLHRAPRGHHLHQRGHRAERMVYLSVSPPHDLRAMAARHPPWCRASLDDLSQRCVHAVRVEGPLRGCDHRLLSRPALRPHRSERRGQVDVHEAADRRAGAAARERDAARRSSACSSRTSSPSTSFRVIDTVIMGNPRLWDALQERDTLYAKHDIDRRRRHAPRRARGDRR